MKKTCKYEIYVSAWMDGELPEKMMPDFLKHLEGCPACRETLEAYQLGDNLFSSVEEIEPSHDFDRRFWEKIDAMEQRKSIFQVAMDAIFGKQKMRFVYAFSILFMAGAIFFTVNPFTPSEDDILMAENLELLQDYEMIRHLDLLENWEAVSEIKEKT